MKRSKTLSVVCYDEAHQIPKSALRKLEKLNTSKFIEGLSSKNYKEVNNNVENG